MLTKFQGCYSESLRKNESLGNMITPKCFDSKADYEFFVVSSHSEQPNTGAPFFLISFWEKPF